MVKTSLHNIAGKALIPGWGPKLPYEQIQQRCYREKVCRDFAGGAADTNPSASASAEIPSWSRKVPPSPRDMSIEPVGCKSDA